jgi:heme/copper-type cytochrome/quinol oxidase subunit 2
VEEAAKKIAIVQEAAQIRPETVERAEQHIEATRKLLQHAESVDNYLFVTHYILVNILLIIIISVIICYFFNNAADKVDDAAWRKGAIRVLILLAAYALVLLYVALTLDFLYTPQLWFFRSGLF